MLEHFLSVQLSRVSFHSKVAMFGIIFPVLRSKSTSDLMLAIAKYTSQKY